MKADEAVRLVREAAGLSQAQFAAQLQVHRVRVTQVEGGQGTFRPPVIVRLCHIFKGPMRKAGVKPLDFMRVK